MTNTTENPVGNDGGEIITFDESDFDYMPVPAVSWGAIIAGAVAASAVSLALMILGSSLGLAVLSPWQNDNPSPTAFTVHAAIWMIVMQWVSSALGGYMSGRLRTQWMDAHDDEIYFRDTAHGFLTWAVATVFTAALLTSAVSSVISGGAQAVTAVAAGAAAGADDKDTSGSKTVDPVDVYVDGLFRSTQPAVGASDGDLRAETSRLLMNAIGKDELTPGDKDYLIQLVVRRTGVTQEEATARVNDLIAKIDNAKVEAKKAVDTARKTAATVSLFTFLSMLVGAFIASVAAGIGGRNRDEY